MRSIVFFCAVWPWLMLYPGIGSAQGRVWEVPANSTGNRLLLTVENTGAAQTKNIRVSVENLSRYLHFQPSELLLGPLAPGESQEVMLTFSVDRTALVGHVDDITVVISGNSGSWQKTLFFRYTPPSTYRLEQNFPNPFNPSTTIRYQLPADGRVSLTVYDVLGREVASLVDNVQEAGYYDVVWDAQNVSSGMYFYGLLISGVDGSTHSSIKKMMLMK